MKLRRALVHEGDVAVMMSEALACMCICLSEFLFSSGKSYPSPASSCSATAQVTGMESAAYASSCDMENEKVCWTIYVVLCTSFLPVSPVHARQAG